MLVRLLQNFDRIDLAPDAQPRDSLPPASWAKASGRKATQKFWPKSHLTMYSHVCPASSALFNNERGITRLNISFDAGGSVGQIERSGSLGRCLIFSELQL